MNFKTTDLDVYKSEMTYLSKAHPDIVAHLDPSSNPYLKIKKDPPVIPPRLESALSIGDQIRLIEKGDPRSLAFFALEEKTQILEQAQDLAQKIGETEQQLSLLKKVGQKIDGNTFEFLTQLHERLSHHTAEVEMTRTKLQEAYDQLTRLSRSTPEARFQSERNQLHQFLERIDAQIFASKALLKNLEELEVMILQRGQRR
jgi:hypothetical protein